MTNNDYIYIKAWDRLPKHLQEQYEHNIFTREF